MEGNLLNADFWTWHSYSDHQLTAPGLPAPDKASQTLAETGQIIPMPVSLLTGELFVVNSC